MLLIGGCLVVASVAITLLLLSTENGPSPDALKIAVSPTAQFKLHVYRDYGSGLAWEQHPIDSHVAQEIVALCQGAEPQVLDAGGAWEFRWGFPPIQRTIRYLVNPAPDNVELQVFELDSAEPTLRIGFLTSPQRDSLRVNLWGASAKNGFHLVTDAHRARLFQLLQQLTVSTPTITPTNPAAESVTEP